MESCKHFCHFSNSCLGSLFRGPQSLPVPNHGERTVVFWRHRWSCWCCWSSHLAANLVPGVWILSRMLSLWKCTKPAALVPFSHPLPYSTAVPVSWGAASSPRRWLPQFCAWLHPPREEMIKLYYIFHSFLLDFHWVRRSGGWTDAISETCTPISYKSLIFLCTGSLTFLGVRLILFPRGYTPNIYSEASQPAWVNPRCQARIREWSPLHRALLPLALLGWDRTQRKSRAYLTLPTTWLTPGQGLAQHCSLP